MLIAGSKVWTLKFTKTNDTDLNKDQKDRIRRAAELEGKISRITEKTANEIEGKGKLQPAEKDGN